MPGNFRSGPHPKFNDCAASRSIVGLPQRPDGLDEWGAWLWDLVVSDLAEHGIARKLDTAMLWSMCEMWSMYRRSYDAATENPVDKDARCAVIAYWTAFERAASRCGLTPADRARLNVAPEVKKPSVATRTRA